MNLNLLFDVPERESASVKSYKAYSSDLKILAELQESFNCSEGQIIRFALHDLHSEITNKRKRAIFFRSIQQEHVKKLGKTIHEQIVEDQARRHNGSAVIPQKSVIPKDTRDPKKCGTVLPDGATPGKG